MQNSNLAMDHFTINADGICEPDEIIRAVFEDQPNLNITYPEVTYIIIENIDCKYENLIFVLYIIILKHSLMISKTRIVHANSVTVLHFMCKDISLIIDFIVLMLCLCQLSVFRLLFNYLLSVSLHILSIHCIMGSSFLEIIRLNSTFIQLQRLVSVILHLCLMKMLEA